MFGFGKGKIDIKLSKYNFNTGQAIQGDVELKLKKSLDGNELSITFFGERRVSRMIGGRRTYQSERVFNFKQPLDGPKKYTAGPTPLVYPFEIVIPTDVANQNIPEGTLGTVIKAAAMLSGSGMTKWYLQARLDVKGLDITKKVQINIA